MRKYIILPILICACLMFTGCQKNATQTVNPTNGTKTESTLVQSEEAGKVVDVKEVLIEDVQFKHAELRDKYNEIVHVYNPDESDNEVLNALLTDTHELLVRLAGSDMLNMSQAELEKLVEELDGMSSVLSGTVISSEEQNYENHIRICY